MRIEDRFVVAAPRERVWVAIKDPAIVAPCIPGCQGVEVVSPVLYKAKIRLQVGPIKAEFNVDVEIVSETPLEEVARGPGVRKAAGPARCRRTIYCA